MSRLNGTPERAVHDRHRNTREVRPDTPLRPDLQQILDEAGFNKFPTLNKNGVHGFLNKKGTSIKKNAIVVAFTNGEIASGLFSGQRLTSEYDAMKWALQKMSVESQSQASA